MVGIMVVVSGLIVTVMTTGYDQHTLDRQREHLRAIASSRARMIEAIARSEGAEREAHHESPRDTTLDLVVAAHEAFPGLGETREFTLARLEGDQITFVLRHRHDSDAKPAPVPMDGELAEPMRRALRGLSGTVIGPDYRSETVLAAHEPVGAFDLGIVAKMDLAEIQAPILRTGHIAGGISTVLVLLGAALPVRVGNPLIQRLEEDAQALEAEVLERRQAQAELQLLSSAVEQTSESVMITNQRGLIEYVNPAFETNTGFLRGEVLQHKPDMLRCPELPATVYEAIVDESGVPTHYVSVRKDVTSVLLLGPPAAHLLPRRAQPGHRGVAAWCGS